ncbi:beta-lactamase superfamily II metal-dependent hydrolase [Nocardioides cavernae]|uniref:Beta-lactamase superfamily II metal-dependent hydrolase n=1 Tax=Nocardioides cavernae TaxID=1921566 RepID=A0A7Y9H212_9ACTN|nr:MBL fold metallo-hydrolase [Nocardioides cavernae]NYE35664.1 beta-lactamase superfamily II metal-dependent hydrolase [Nocardioides cavernae]
MIEIDFLWVGEESKTGDAIGCRFTDPSTGRTVVVLIDGGFAETGDRIVNHVEKYYNTNVVDLVVCTHPDNDHIGGTSTVIEKLTVRRLLIHRPSQHGFSGDDYKSGAVENLVNVAILNGTVVDDSSFAGAQYFGGALTIAGPSEANYKAFLSGQAEYNSVANRVLRLLAESAASAKRAVRKVLGSDPGETLTGDNGGTTPRNNTSVICNLVVDGYRALLTGDAGEPALSAAADYLDSIGLGSQRIDFFDVPHHGSRHNLTKDLCDRLLGPVAGDMQRGSAYVTVGQKAEDHPRSEVANAIRRRGYPVYQARGINIWWHRGTPNRLDYGPIQPLGWLDESA